MPQFSGHWYSGRAARLVLVEVVLVGLAMWISAHQAHGWREVAALIAAAACVPAALYLSDLYDPQVMRNDRSRGSSVLKALGFAALAAAVCGLFSGGGLPRGALIDTIGAASVGVLLARAALVARLDESGHNRVLVIGAGHRAAEIERIIRTEAYGEYEVAGQLDPAIDLAMPSSEPQQAVASAGGDGLIAAPGNGLVAVPGHGFIEQSQGPSGEVAYAGSPTVVAGTQLIVGPSGAPAQMQGPMAEAKVAAMRTASASERSRSRRWSNFRPWAASMASRSARTRSRKPCASCTSTPWSSPPTSGVRVCPSTSSSACVSAASPCCRRSASPSASCGASRSRWCARAIWPSAKG